MAPRALRTITCFSIAVKDVALPADEEAAAAHGAKKRGWTGEIKRKILASMRRERIGAAKEQAATTQRLRPALKRGDRSPRAGAVDRKGLRVRFVLPEEDTSAAPAVEPPFPTGVLGEPPESFRHSGPEMTAAFLMSLTAGADGAALIDHEIVARRTERMEACSRRLNYLRDYCPFQRKDDEEGGHSAPETTTLPAEPDHAEEALSPAMTGLPFGNPESESESEFVKAIYSTYLLKDDFISRHAYERNRDQYSASIMRRQESLMAAGEDPAAVQIAVEVRCRIQIAVE